MCPEQSWKLEPDATTPRRARRWVYQALQLWDLDGLEDLDDLAEVLTSELVTNAVRHARTEFVLRLIWDVGRLRVEVEDGSAAPPVVQPHGRNHRGEGGYGLLIVEQLADAWGSESTPSGKRVWCEIWPGRRRKS